VPRRQPITPNGPASSPSGSRCFGRRPLPTQNVHREPATPEPSRRTTNPANHAIGPIRTPRRSACARRCRSGKAADAAAKIRRRQTTLRYTPVHAQMVQLAPPGYVHERDQQGHNSLLLLNNESMPDRFAQQCENGQHSRFDEVSEPSGEPRAFARNRMPAKCQFAPNRKHAAVLSIEVRPLSIIDRQRRSSVDNLCGVWLAYGNFAGTTQVWGRNVYSCE